MVLVVDPNETTRSVLELCLSRDGFDVVSAMTSRKALEFAKRRTPDVVVVEAELGEEDGFSFVAQLRGDAGLGRVPVLLLASTDDRDVDALAQVVGIDAFIHKPAFARDVVALVRLEHARRAGTDQIVFEADQLPPAQLLRALLSTPRSGHLTLAGGHASVTFRQGRVIDVGFDAPHGDLDALVRALALTTGTYSVELVEVPESADLRCGLRELVTLVMPRLAKFAQVQVRSVPLDARLVVDFARLTATLNSLPDGINGVLQLFDGFRTLLEVLIDSPVNETLTLEVATRLFLLNVLKPAPVHDSVAPVAPRLFEPQADEAKELLRDLFAGAEVSAEPSGRQVSEDDWFEEPRGTGLEIAEPSGGWTMADSARVLLDLPDDLHGQLEAFNIQIEVEEPELSATTKDIGEFVREGIAEASETGSLEEALSLMTGTAAVLNPVPVVTAAPAVEVKPLVEVVDTKPVVVEVKPVVVEVKPVVVEVKPVVVEVKPVVEPLVPRPVVKMPYQAPAVVTPALDVTQALEAQFFEPSQAELAAAPSVPVKQARRVTPWVSLALGVVVLAVVLEVLVQPQAEATAVVPAPAPVAAPVVAVAPVVATPVVEAPAAVDEAAPEEVLDISENLVEARRAYEAGQYAKASSVLQQTLVDAPKSVDGWLLLALVRYDAHDTAGAKAAAERVLSLDHANARVQILVAALAFDEHDRAAGRAALERYLELEPTGQYARDAHALLKR
jgi:DNA-binding response OmpR family regulator/cytochrome c-type biogenesis protein CcmH/NrfG